MPTIFTATEEAVRQVRQGVRQVRQGVRPITAIRVVVHRDRQGGKAQRQEAYQTHQAQAHQAHQAQAQDPTSTSMLWQPLSAKPWDLRLVGAAMGMLLPLQARAAVLLRPLRALVPLQWPWIR